MARTVRTVKTRFSPVLAATLALAMSADLQAADRVLVDVVKQPYSGARNVPEISMNPDYIHAAGLERMIADEAGSTADDYRVVRSCTATTETTVTLPGNVEGRYVLLWITNLADNRGGSELPFSAEVAEVELFG